MSVRRTINLENAPREVSFSVRFQLTHGNFIALMGWVCVAIASLWLWTSFAESTSAITRALRPIAVTPWSWLFGLALPLGLFMLGMAPRAGREQLGIFVRGRLAWGRLVKKDVHRSRKGHRSYGLTYEYVDDQHGDGYRGEVVRRRAYRFAGSDAEAAPITDESEEPLLYDPAAPELIILLDALPGGVRIANDGRIMAAPARLIVGVLTPLMVVAMNGWLLAHWVLALR